MRLLTLFVLIVAVPQSLCAQNGVSFNSYKAFKDSLVVPTQITDALGRDAHPFSKLFQGRRADCGLAVLLEFFHEANL